MRLARRVSNLSIVRASTAKRLWIAAASVALFILTVWAAQALRPVADSRHRGAGLDFLAFYTAGSFVGDGMTDRLYDLEAVKHFQRQTASKNGFDIGSAYGPWWNPPFYAMPFVPLARLPYRAALLTWVGINLACFTVACVLLCRMLPADVPSMNRALVPVLTILSTPFIFAISHAQNTCTSLLLMTIAVSFWRARRPLAAGLVGGLLFYKPQLALVFAAVMVLDLGWRSFAGYAITGIALLGANLIVLPGTLTDYLHRLPENLHFVQTGSVYLWEQHVTVKAFWRLLLQGRTAGQTSVLVTALTATCVAAIGALLVRSIHPRPTGADFPGFRRDRLIAATIVATPLLMPFYFDYDLLLLAVPAVLLSAEYSSRQPGYGPSDRMLIAAWAGLYAWQMINTDVAERVSINFSVALLAVVSVLMIRRVRSRPINRPGLVSQTCQTASAR